MSDELENTAGVETTESGENQQDAEMNFEEMAAKTAMALQQIARMNNTVAMILVNPDLLEGYVNAVMALPEQAIPQEVKERLPIHPDPDVEEVYIVTGAEVERQFLEQHFGPTEHGGNGLIPRMKDHLTRNPYPVVITIDWLRNRYLDEVADSVSSKIVRATVNTDLNSILRSR
jgi:hypothetical protein